MSISLRDYKIQIIFFGNNESTNTRDKKKIANHLLSAKYV